jgi:transcriptional regulator with XRE-family HTH domain
MNPAQFRATLTATGLSQAQLARLLKVNRNTPTNWAKGNTEVPHAVAILLDLLARGGVSVEDLEA